MELHFHNRVCRVANDCFCPSSPFSRYNKESVLNLILSRSGVFSDEKEKVGAGDICKTTMFSDCSGPFCYVYLSVA